jgi:hypothetical protein
MACLEIHGQVIAIQDGPAFGSVSQTGLGNPHAIPSNASAQFANAIES